MKWSLGSNLTTTRGRTWLPLSGMERGHWLANLWQAEAVPPPPPHPREGLCGASSLRTEVLLCACPACGPACVSSELGRCPHGGGQAVPQPWPVSCPASSTDLCREGGSSLWPADCRLAWEGERLLIAVFPGICVYLLPLVTVPRPPVPPALAL